jgi:hypothetical protein
VRKETRDDDNRAGPAAGSDVERAVRVQEYKVIDTGKQIEQQLNDLGGQGWRVVGVTTKKQLFIAPPQAIILMRKVTPTA